MIHHPQQSGSGSPASPPAIPFAAVPPLPPPPPPPPPPSLHTTAYHHSVRTHDELEGHRHGHGDLVKAQIIPQPVPHRLGPRSACPKGPAHHDCLLPGPMRNLGLCPATGFGRRSRPVGVESESPARLASRLEPNMTRRRAGLLSGSPFCWTAGSLCLAAGGNIDLSALQIFHPRSRYTPLFPRWRSRCCYVHMKSCDAVPKIITTLAECDINTVIPYGRHY